MFICKWPSKVSALLVKNAHSAKGYNRNEDLQMEIEESLHWRELITHHSCHLENWIILHKWPSGIMFQLMYFIYPGDCAHRLFYLEHLGCNLFACRYIPSDFKQRSSDHMGKILDGECLSANDHLRIVGEECSFCQGLKCNRRVYIGEKR